MAFLEVVELKKTYEGPRSVEVLKGVNFSVDRGEMVAVVGESGVGKTTLLLILGALEKPTGGRVLLDGRDVFSSYRGGALDRFRNRFCGFIFQFHHLIPEFTALENVAMPALICEREMSSALKQARDLLEELGLGDRIDHKPGELSGGEQQRVAVARALINEPALVLADEPTGNLDQKTGDALFEVLLELNRKRNTTFVVVTHNERLANKLPRRIRLIDGRAVEES